MLSVKRIFFCLAALPILNGCTKSEVESTQLSEKITFRTVTYDTKAQTYTPDSKGGNVINSMGIFASATGQQNYDPAIHSVNFMQNVEISRQSVSEPWIYQDPQYWASGYTTFFAYAPYNAVGGEVSVPAKGEPTISFTVRQKQSEQVDLLVAKAEKDRTKTTSAVVISMQHALTRIGFKAKISHPTSDIESIDVVKVVKIEVEGVYSSARHTLDASSPQGWYELSGVKSSANPFVLSIEKEPDGDGGGLKNIELDHTQTQPLNTDDGFLMMIPQNIDESKGGKFAKLRLYLTTDSHSTTGSSEAIFVDPIEFDLQHSGVNWKQGDAIIYTINIDLSDHTTTNSTLKAEVVDWDEINPDVSILNRRLELTRISARVNGSALTRIHFWSNQPKVWIDPKGNSDVGGYPAGSEFIVDNLYLALAGEGASNLHYDTSVPRDASGGWAGYFDVENAANVQGDYHLYLCADTDYSGTPLRRSVKLRNILPHISQDNISTNYVGVFHRGNQVGERIITWRGTTNWTAVIETQKSAGGLYDDYKHVLMDRFTSPAYEAGILYTDNPGDAEDYRVSPWRDVAGGGVSADGRRWVSGANELYLRVGWDSYAPGAPYKKPVGAADIPSGDNYRNRYAIITIRKGVNSPDGQILHTLYLRQGELDDYLMNPDGDSYIPDNLEFYWSYNNSTKSYSYSGKTPAVSQRPYARRFSPYNLSDPSKGKGGGSLSEHNEIGVRGAVFTDFPSQAGYLFRFNDMLRAFNPANPGVGGGTISGVTHYNANNPWDAARDETAPAGYRRPREHYAESKTLFDYSLSEFAQSLFIQPAANKLSNGEGILDNSGRYNSSQGWYADGFFDRRPIKGVNNSETAVGEGGDVAYFGSLYYNPRTLSSLFLPHAGDRFADNGRLEWPGQSGMYWSSSQNRDNYSYAWGLDFYESNYSPRFAITYQGYKGRAHAVRCVVEDI